MAECSFKHITWYQMCIQRTEGSVHFQPDEAVHCISSTWLGADSEKWTEWNGNDRKKNKRGGWVEGIGGHKAEVRCTQQGRVDNVPFAKWQSSPWRSCWHWLLVPPIWVLGTLSVAIKRKHFAQAQWSGRRQSHNEAAVCFNVTPKKAR